MLEEKKEQVEKLANVLLEKETVELDELIEILGEKEVNNEKEQEKFDEYINDLKANRKK